MDSRRPERLHRRWRRAAGWALLAIAVTLPGSVAAAAPAPAPAVSDARAELIQRTPAPGRLIQVAGLGHQHLWCRGPIPGPTTPTVVVISGAGDFSLSWRQVQSRLASHNRVCTYDRAGLGWSATGPSPRTGATIVDELTDLLAAGDIHGPLVMVGHSMGGIYARMFAARHPGRVRAVALIDPGDERLDVTVPAAERAGMRAGTAAAVTRQLASGRQCTADVFAHDLSLLPLVEDLPLRDARTYRRLQAARCRMWRTVAAEGLGAATTWKQARRLDLGAGSLGHRPVAVLVSDADVPLVADPALNAVVLRQWRALQRTQAQLSDRSTFAVAPGSSHLMMLDRPGAVARTIRWALHRVR